MKNSGCLVIWGNERSVSRLTNGLGQLVGWFCKKGDEAGEEVALEVGGWGGNCEFTLGPC